MNGTIELTLIYSEIFKFKMATIQNSYDKVYLFIHRIKENDVKINKTLLLRKTCIFTFNNMGLGSGVTKG